MNTKQKAEAWLKEVGGEIHRLEPNIRADHERYIEIITALLKEREALLSAAKKYFHYQDETFRLPQDIKNLQASKKALHKAIALCEKEHE